MTNAIYIDVDTERENPITFGKPQDIAAPTSKEEAQTMVLLDIQCVAEALNVLIHMAHQNGYGDRDELVKASVSTITDSTSTILTPTDESEEPTT